ncbi:MAG: hypothetical protein K2K44_08710 [Oscillospiraceae bacterium]|nr:hypothetical protein [Oscillospiraceae bacterium]
MKKSKATILLIFTLAMALSGCSSASDSGGETSSISAEATAETTETSQTEETTSETSEADVTEETAEVATTLISSEENNLTEEERQIQNLLQESRKIFYDYVLGKEMQNHVGWGKSITIPITYDSGETYDSTIYEIVDGDVLSISDMQDKMRPFFTDKMIDYIFKECNHYYYEENGKLYVSDGVGSEGGGLGVDTLHITSVETTDEDTLVLYMVEFGAGENWGLYYDLIENFTVTLKRTDNGFKIDECDKIAIERLARCYTPEDDIFG